MYYYENGNVDYERYYINGIKHREDGPAYICCYENGSVECEEYYINGKLHREYGPAHTEYYENGNIKLEEYYINGVSLTKKEWYSRLSAEQKVNFLYRVLNEQS
jgi:hypothetical protein